VSENSFRVL